MGPDVCKSWPYKGNPTAVKSALAGLRQLELSSVVENSRRENERRRAEVDMMNLPVPPYNEALDCLDPLWQAAIARIDSII